MTQTNILKRKICLIGDNMVGKTSLIRRFVHNEFSDEYISTIGTQISRKKIAFSYPKNKKGAKKYNITFSIWDIVGQREYRSLALRHFVEASGALIVCDITRKDTLENLHEWLNPLYFTAGNIPTLLLINKNDLKNLSVIDQEEIKDFTDKYEIPYLYTSAKTGNNVDEAFHKLGEWIIEFSDKQDTPTTIIQLTDTITTDFCETLGGFEKGMPIFQEQFKKTNGTFSSPTKKDLIKLSQNLIKIIQKEKGAKVAKLKEKQYEELLKELK